MSSVCRWVGPVVCWSASVMAQKVPDLRIDRAPGTARSQKPVLAADGDRVYVAWFDDRAGAGQDIHCNRSVTAGAQWLAADVRLNTGSAAGATTARAPKIAAAGSRVYVVWQDNRAGRLDIHLNASADGGATWRTPDVRVDTDAAGSANSRAPAIAAAGAAVYVAWQEDRNGQGDIHFNRSLDGGASWLGADVRIDLGDAAGATRSAITQIEAQGSAVYVVWRDERNGRPDVYFNRSLDAGATWLPAVVRLNTAGAATASKPEIAASGAHVYVTWFDDRAVAVTLSDIYFNRSTDGGATWLAQDIRINSGSYPGISAAWAQSIAAVDDTVYITWHDNRLAPAVTAGGPFDIYMNRSLDAGASWMRFGTRINLGSARGTTDARDPVVAAAGSMVAIAWRDRRGGVESTFVNRSLDRGATWLNGDVRLDTSNVPLPPPAQQTVFLRPQLTASRDRVYAVWNDDVSGDEDIYFNIPFGFQPYGVGTAGTGGLVPQLAGSGLPTLGGAVALDVTNGFGGAPAALWLGGPGSQTSVPVLGGTVLVLPAATPGFALGGAGAGAGMASVPFVLPDDPSLLGVNLNFQAIFLDFGAVQSVSMTGGVALWMG